MAYEAWDCSVTTSMPPLDNFLPRRSAGRSRQFRHITGAEMNRPKTDARQDKLNREFVDAANPHSWLLSASNLNDEAVYLRRNFGQARLTQTDGNQRILRSWDMTDKSLFC